MKQFNIFCLLLLNNIYAPTYTSTHNNASDTNSKPNTKLYNKIENHLSNNANKVPNKKPANGQNATNNALPSSSKKYQTTTHSEINTTITDNTPSSNNANAILINEKISTNNVQPSNSQKYNNISSSEISNASTHIDHKIETKTPNQIDNIHAPNDANEAQNKKLENLQNITDNVLPLSSKNCKYNAYEIIELTMGSQEIINIYHFFKNMTIQYNEINELNEQLCDINLKNILFTNYSNDNFISIYKEILGKIFFSLGKKFDHVDLSECKKKSVEKIDPKLKNEIRAFIDLTRCTRIFLQNNFMITLEYCCKGIKQLHADQKARKNLPIFEQQLYLYIVKLAFSRKQLGMEAKTILSENLSSEHKEVYRILDNYITSWQKYYENIINLRNFYWEDITNFVARGFAQKDFIKKEENKNCKRVSTINWEEYNIA